MKNIFITGISGCVGHYIFDLLSINPNYRLFLLTRNPEKFAFQFEKYPKVKTIVDGLENIEKYSILLKKMDMAIHLAASWGGEKTYHINVEKTISLFSLLDIKRCEKVIYFSTASILGENGKPNLESFQNGTDYIKSKFLGYKSLPKTKINDRIITVFPTVILGGDKNHPYSHANQELKKLKKYLHLIKYFKISGSFHFIHAYDIALITDYILEYPIRKNELILGNPVISINNCIQQLCEIAKIKRKVSMNITPIVVKLLPLIFKKKMSKWDVYSLKKRNFQYNTINPKTFGLQSPYNSIKNCFS
jgi:nucleoside-diphosphate-sugar epimerase